MSDGNLSLEVNLPVPPYAKRIWVEYEYDLPDYSKGESILLLYK